MPGTISMLFSILSACLCAWVVSESMTMRSVSCFSCFSLFFILMFLGKDKHGLLFFPLFLEFDQKIDLSCFSQKFVRKTQKEERKFNNDIGNLRKVIIGQSAKNIHFPTVKTTLGRYLKARTHFEKRQTKLLRLIRALNNKTFPFLYYVFKFVKGHRIMSANPFAALGEDGPNPVAAKGAIFFGKEMLTGIRLVSRRGANCKRNRHRESSTRDLFSLKTNRNQRKYNSCVRIDWF